MYFLALSQAPPALAIMMASSTPVTVAPASSPPSARAQEQPDERAATTTAISAGDDHLPECRRRCRCRRSGRNRAWPAPSMIPGISRNWRRTSSTILMAARPTACMASAQKRNGSIPPRKSPHDHLGLGAGRSVQARRGGITPKRAPARSAPPSRWRSPSPMAAVVLPTESSLSVTLPHLFGQAGHLRDAARVVGDRAVGVDGDRHARGGQHAHRRHRDPVQARPRRTPTPIADRR